MDIKMPSGCVFATDNQELIEQFLKYGGTEVKAVKPATNKKSTKVND